MRPLFSFFGTFTDFGLLALRVTLGLTYGVLGWQKITGGPAVWQSLGKSMEMFGLSFGAEIWGMLAALFELVGGAMLLLGAATRAAALAVLGVMLVAVTVNVANFSFASQTSVHALLFSLVCTGGLLCLLTAGGGRFGLENPAAPEKAEKPKR